MPVKGVALTVREAQLSDAQAISDIYNHYVETSTCTFELQPESHQKRTQWLKDHEAEKLPVIVVEQNGVVVAWGSLSYYHSRCAYRQSVEPSIYVHHDHTKKGLGSEVMRNLIDLARARNYHCLVGLACSENAFSIRMSESLGFQKIGELKEVGRKFDRWLDVMILQMLLT